MTGKVIVPYRFGTPNGLRVMNLRRVREYLYRNYFDVFVAGCGDPWSPGKARNEGTRWTSDTILLFNDADTICPNADQMLQALGLAQDAPGLVYAYDLYIREGEDGSAIDTLYRPPSMGCVAISRESFEQVGGFDESYKGWGYEDVDFAQRCQALWPIRRVTGPVYHLWHGERRDDDSPCDSDPAQVAANEERWKRTLSTV